MSRDNALDPGKVRRGHDGRMLREKPIESRDGESLEGVGKTRLTTNTIFTDYLFTSQREMHGN